MKNYKKKHSMYYSFILNRNDTISIKGFWDQKNKANINLTSITNTTTIV